MKNFTDEMNKRAEEAVKDRVIRFGYRPENVIHQVLRDISPDECCHKTRIKDGGCPIGWICPYIKEKE